MLINKILISKLKDGIKYHYDMLLLDEWESSWVGGVPSLPGITPFCWEASLSLGINYVCLVGGKSKEGREGGRW